MKSFWISIALRKGFALKSMVRINIIVKLNTFEPNERTTFRFDHRRIAG
jgi:hypothetical protein